MTNGTNIQYGLQIKSIVMIRMRNSLGEEIKILLSEGKMQLHIE
jgi:hypothetical protein